MARRYNGVANMQDHARALAIDDSGNVRVTGSSDGIDGNFDYVMIKYATPTGDVTCDGIIDLTDLVLLGNFLEGIIDLTGICRNGQADVDRDGDVDEEDYYLLFDSLAGHRTHSLRSVEGTLEPWENPFEIGPENTGGVCCV